MDLESFVSRKYSRNIPSVADYTRYNTTYQIDVILVA